jgi:hypothetical protein
MLAYGARRMGIYKNKVIYRAKAALHLGNLLASAVLYSWSYISLVEGIR